MTTWTASSFAVGATKPLYRNQLIGRKIASFVGILDKGLPPSMLSSDGTKDWHAPYFTTGSMIALACLGAR